MGVVVFYWVSLLFNVGEFWEDWERPLQWKGRVCSGRRAGPPDYHSPELVFLYFCAVVFLFSCILVFEYVLVISSLIIHYYNYHRFLFILFYLTGQFEKSVPESYGRHFFILCIFPMIFLYLFRIFRFLQRKWMLAGWTSPGPPGSMGGR